MFTKKTFVLFALILVCTTLFAWSPPQMRILIRNSSSNNMIVNMGFWYGPGSNLVPGIAWSDNIWTQTISGIPFSVRILSREHETNLVHSGQEIHILQFSGPFGQFDRMIDILLQDIMNATFERFEVIDNEGKAIITLENLEEIVVERRISTGEVWYVLEISDPEAEEGSNASYAR